MADKKSISHFFATMPVASFFSDFLDERKISMEVPDNIANEKEAYVKSINATFGVETSMADRLGLYTLYSNHSKLKKLIEIVLMLSGNESKMNYNDIVEALNQLKKSSKSIAGGGNPKQILQFIMMLSVLIGNIYILKCMMNSFSYKYENSVAYQTMSVLTSENCKAPQNINPLIDYTFQSLSETNLLSKNEQKVISSLFNTYKCIINPENVKVMQYDETEMVESYGLMDSPNHQEYLALPAPSSTQIAVLPSFEKWNQDNSVQLFSDKILTKFGELQQASGLGVEQFIDSLIKDDIKSSVDSKSTMKQGTTFMDVVNWVGSQAGGIIKTNINELKEGRINPTFANDIWPEIKHIAKMKKAYYMYKMNILEAKSEKAIDEIYSLFIHAACMLALTTTTILVQSKILYKYTKTVLSKSKSPLQLTNSEPPVSKSKSKKASLKFTAIGGKKQKQKTKRRKQK